MKKKYYLCRLLCRQTIINPKRSDMKKFLLVIIALGFGFSLWADDDCLYPTLNGLKGDAILDELHELIKDHTVLDYFRIRADQSRVDVVDGRVIDMYSNCNFSASDDYCKDVEADDDCICYNREHTLPKSWWGHDENNPEPMYTDLYHVVPTCANANYSRSNLPYGELDGDAAWENGFSKVGKGSSLGNVTDVFEPNARYKGDIARIYFYMVTCYRDKNFAQAAGTWFFKYSSKGVVSFRSNKVKALLMKWHRNDAVSEEERRRAQRVAAIQGNHNPFVEYPELAEYIWGDNTEDTYYCGGTPLYEVQEDDAVLDTEQPMYNAVGQKVDASYHGIVIQNGHKFLLQ